MASKIAEVLKDLRARKGVGQKDLAEYLKIDRTTYTKYETGDSTPDYEKLQKIASFFKVSIDFLIYGFEPVRLGDIVDFIKAGRTDEQFAIDTGVDKEYLWSIIAEVVPERPTLEILKKLYDSRYSNFDEHYDYPALLEAAGYLDEAKRHRLGIDLGFAGEIKKTLAASRKDGYDTPLTDDEAIAVKAYLEAYRKMKEKKED